jgi:chromosome segregation protein
VRALAAELDISRATAEAELSHLAQQSLDAVQADLDQVAEEVAEMERQGIHAPDARVIRRAVAEAAESTDGDDTADAVSAIETGAEAVAGDAAVAEAAQAAMTAEEAIAELRAQIERLGPVNMMAIQQFTELDERRVFLTTQRQDLIDSSRRPANGDQDRRNHACVSARRSRPSAHLLPSAFRRSSAAARRHHAARRLRSARGGIDIVASPPGKRLQA